MQVASLLSGLSAPTEQEKRRHERIAEEFAEYLRLDEQTPEEQLSKYTKKGVQSLIEARIDELKKRLTQQAMQARGVTQQSLDAMDENTRTTTMAEIMEEVNAQLKQLVAEMFTRDLQEELKRKEGIEFVFKPVIQADAVTEMLHGQEGLDLGA